MKSVFFSIITALTYAVNISSAVHFKVICAAADYGGTGVTVYIDGQPSPMQSNGDILYELDYEGTPKEYYYEVTGTQQNELTIFTTPRVWDPESTTTLYEVFGRRYTVGDDFLATVPRLYEPLEGYDKFSPLFQEGETPVINVHMAESDLNTLTSLTQNQEELKFTISFELYTPYEQFKFTNVTLSLSGQGSKGQEKKPYKIKLSEGDEDKSNTEIFSRKEFKLRSIRFDESGIKNKIVSDMAESLALPMTQSTLCRLYMNNQSYGLYELADMYKKKFVRRFFNVEKNTDDYIYGSLYKGVSSDYPAYLYTEFPGETVQRLYENVVPPTAGYDPHQDIQTMMAWLEALPDNASKEEIEKKFDLEMCLKYLILEYLSCHWDGYLSNGNNFFVYVEPNDKKYHFFSYDFDMTLGKWCPKTDGTIDDYVEKANDKTNYGPTLPKRKPLLYNKIIKNPNIEPRFNELLKEIVGNLFNMKALEPRIDYFYKFLYDDLMWDIFSYNFIKTQFFGSADKQSIPTEQVVTQEYTDLTNIETLKGYIKAKSENVAQLYGVSELKAEGKHGTVGGKLMTIGK